MANVSKIKLPNNSSLDVKALAIPIGTVDSTSTSTVFTFTVPGITSLYNGVIFAIRNTVVASASGWTANVNGLGAKQVYGSNNTRVTTGFAKNYWYIFVYDEANNRWTQAMLTDANSTYTNVALGQGYGTCTTAAATAAKVVTLASYALTTGGIVAVKFNNDVPANATMNVNSKGAKAIYHRGAAITAGVIKGGDTAYFIYSTYYHLLGVDRIISKVSDLTNDAGYTTNIGTITGITMNGVSKGTSGVVDLGTVVTSDEKVKQSPSTDNSAFEVLLSGTADNTERTEITKKSSTLKYNPSTKALVTGGTVDGYTLNAAAGKAVDSSIAAGSTSTNLPTSAAVASALSGKQDTLVSGTNIKTVNNESLLGSGNIAFSGSNLEYTGNDGEYISGGDSINSSLLLLDEAVDETNGRLDNLKGSQVVYDGEDGDATIINGDSISVCLKGLDDQVASLTSNKQAALVSGTNIKTINNNSLLGSGNISVGTVTGSSLTANNIILGSGSSAIKSSGKTIATTLGTDNTTVPTSKAVKDAIDALPEPMIFQGTLGTGGTITSLPAAAAGNTGYTYKVITDGTYQSIAAKAGDTFISNGSSWTLIPSGDEPSGTVTNIATGTGLTGGPITTTGTISIDTTTVATKSDIPTTLDQIADGNTRKLSDFILGSRSDSQVNYNDIAQVNALYDLPNGKIYALPNSDIIGDSPEIVDFILATTNDIPTESTVSGWGFTKNAGTVTSVGITNGGGLSVSGNPVTSSGSITVSHADTSSQASVNNSGRTYIQDITLDGYGHVTGISSATETVTNTDTSVTAEANHYDPTADSNSELTATIDGTAGSFVTNTEYTVLTGVKAQRDSKGHVTGLTYTAQKVKDTTVANTDTKVRQYQSGANAAGSGTKYPLLSRYGLTNKNGSYDANYARFHTGATVDTSTGNIEAPAFIKTGGTSSQFLKADGSSDSNTYLTSFTETDPVFGASAAAGITASDITNWNGKTSNTGTVTGVKMNGTTNNPTSGVVDLGTVITSETSLSKGTGTGSGNAVTDISVSGHKITLTKGKTFLESEIDPIFSASAAAGITSSDITNWNGKTSNTGTITSVKMNGSTVSSSGEADLGTVITSHAKHKLTTTNGSASIISPGTAITYVESLIGTTTATDGDLSISATRKKITVPSAPGTLDTTATTAQSTSSSEALSGNITLHKVAKTGTYSDLIGTPTIPSTLDQISDGSTRKLSDYLTISDYEEDEEVIAAAINDLNDKIASKQNTISDLDTIRSNAAAGAAKVSNVQSDWNATSGAAVILNKPTIMTQAEVTSTINTIFS